jgi:hypothetical protein
MVLQKAVAELAKNGTLPGAELVPGGQMRGYLGRLTKQDHVLKLPSFQYDLGFAAEKDGSLKTIAESMYTDVNDALGATRDAKTVDGKACDVHGAKLGRLIQLCNVIAAESEAARKGMMCQRSVDKKTQQIKLVVRAA